MKKATVIMLLISSILIVNGQKRKNILLGKWKIDKTISADLNHYLTKAESKQFVGVTIIFKENQIIAPQNNTFFGGCMHPNYKFKVVNALKYYDNDRKYLKLIGCTTTNIQMVNTTCGLPFDEICIINDNQILFGVDGYLYFLKKAN